MRPSLGLDHTKQLAFLAEQTPQVFQDFCKLAVDYLQKGPNLKLYAAAAQRLEVESEAIRTCVESLIYLLMESIRGSLDEKNFEEFVESLGFREEKQILLTKLYEVKKGEIDQAMGKLGLRLAQYHDMEWRFQVQIASRSLVNQLTPLFTIDLTLKNDDDSLEHVCLQSDPTNMLRLAKEMESALADARTQHIRNIKRSIK